MTRTDAGAGGDGGEPDRRDGNAVDGGHRDDNVVDGGSQDDNAVDDGPPDGGPTDDDARERRNGADILVNERETPEGLLVAVCDGDVLGETFEEGEVSLTVTEEFYGGDAVEAEGVVESLARASVANIVGTRAVGVAIEAGIIDEAHVLEVGSTLHAQLVRLG